MTTRITLPKGIYTNHEADLLFNLGYNKAVERFKEIEDYLKEIQFICPENDSCIYCKNLYKLFKNLKENKNE